MARVLLVNPPFYRIMGSHYNGLSLGIAYIASVLNRHGHDAWLYNADFIETDEYRKLYDCFRDFPNYIDIYRDDRHPIWEETLRSIEAFKPDWVAYTGYTANVQAIQIISKKVAQRLPGARQVLGGVISTLEPRILDSFPHIDFGVRREGEYSMLALVSGEPPESLAGIIARDRRHGGQPPRIRMPDELPFPERDKLWGRQGPLSARQKRWADVSYVITTRGCPYRCSFCASPAIWGRAETTFRSPENVIAEMRHLKENHWQDEHVDFGMLSSNSAPKQDLLKNSLRIRDNTIVYFVDDIFTLKASRTKELLKQMIDSELEMPWKCESRADRLDQEMADLMAAAGCKRVKIGFESGSDRILRQIHKNETKEQMLRGARFLKRAGVPITAYFLAGFPGETDQDLRETIEFARAIEADYYSLSILAPYHGTQIAVDLAPAERAALGKEPYEYFFHQTRKLLVNSTLSEAALEDFWKLCDTSNYL